MTTTCLPLSNQDWLAHNVRHVLIEASAAIWRHAGSDTHAGLLDGLLQSAVRAKRVEGGVCHLAVCMPVVISASVLGEPDPSV